MNIKRIPFVYIAVFIGIIDILADNVMYDEHRLLLWAMRMFTYLFIAFWMRRFVDQMVLNVYRDPLTGLNNRMYLYFYLENKLKGFNNSNISLAVIDIDDFKQINDKYGHLEGDKALVRVANIIMNSIRQSDFVVRWGGEEFVVVLNDADKDKAYQISERIRGKIEMQPFNYNNEEYKLTVSIGIKTTDIKMTVNEMIYEADKLLYKAKEKKNIVLFS